MVKYNSLEKGSRFKVQGCYKVSFTQKNKKLKKLKKSLVVGDTPKQTLNLEP
jgi:hypothetical protein